MTNMSGKRALIALVIWLEAAGFALGAVLHTGIRISFLPGFFHDPQILGATVVEGM